MYAIMAFLPIIVLIVLLAGLNLPARKVMPVAWLVCVISALSFWKMNMTDIMAFSVFGAFKGFDIIITIFGAVLLLNTLKQSEAMDIINAAIKAIAFTHFLPGSLFIIISVFTNILGHLFPEAIPYRICCLRQCSMKLQNC